jgi:phosphohistidine phosphatase
MQVYIIRHGKSEDSHPDGDSARKLVKAGVEKSKDMAKFLKDKTQLDGILTSPYVRAVQTAEVFAKQFNLKEGQLQQSDALLPGTTMEETINALNNSGFEHVAIVGHNPHLSDLCCVLIGDKCHGIDLKKSSVTRIDFDGPAAAATGTLVWMITPGLI